MKPFPIDLLKEWFLKEQRDLPWRRARSPYKVWVSEIMLQQTRSSVVIAYFERWMQEFPTVQALANAPLSKVMKAWEGLGYYSRARNLHRGAKVVCDRYQGELNPEILSEIPGIGPYTRGAVLSFAFQQKVPAIDGNVLRVASRYFMIKKDIGLSSVRKEIGVLIQAFLPEKEPWVAMEGLIELGAQVCVKKPKCSVCPLRGSCLSFMHGIAEMLPLKEKKGKIIPLVRWVAVIYYQEELLVRQEKVGRVMGGLYELPYFATPAIELDIQMAYEKKLSSVKHSFTQYRATLYPSLWKALEKKEIEGFLWVSRKEIANLPFSSGHRKILHEVFSL